MHFTQTEAWQAFQKQLGRQTFRQSGDGWEYLAVLEEGNRNKRLYCPNGPYARDVQSFEEALNSLASLGERLDATFLRVEPTNPEFSQYLANHGARPVTYQSLNPQHSSVVDLSPSEEDLIAQMAQPVRNCYRNYRKKAVEVKTSMDPLDIDIFLKLIHEVAERTGMRPHNDDYFWSQATSLFPAGAAKLWYATHQGLPIAAALLYDSAYTRYYAHAAATSEPNLRKLNAGTAIVAEAIIDAKRSGLKSFDLYGIAPDDSSPHHPWAGFTKFKRSFGGIDVEFGGSWDIPLKSMSYWGYRLYQTFRRYF